MNGAQAQVRSKRFASMYALGSWTLLGCVIYFSRLRGEDSSRHREPNNVNHPPTRLPAPPNPNIRQEEHRYINWLGMHTTVTVVYKERPKLFSHLKAFFNTTDDSDPEK